MVWRVQGIFSAALLLGVLFPGSIKEVLAAHERALAVVETVQMPAWIERRGVRLPLAPGRVLQNRDRILTGAGARVVVALAEGSLARLGENGELALNALGYREQGVFTAALDVTQGAFRLTTAGSRGGARKRALNVRIATITAAVDSADLWGRADAQRDLLCLLEGQAVAVHPLDEAGARGLVQPLSVYFARNGEPPDGVAPASTTQVGLWTEETWIPPNEGAYAHRRGRWNIEVAVLDNEAAALALFDRMNAAGYATRITPQRRAGEGYLYGLRIMQLPTQEGAAALATQVARQFDLSSVRVTR